MSSKNKPTIESLIYAIGLGLNPGQTQDLMQKISDDLNEVHTWIDTGPLPRVLSSNELGGNVAYTDKYDAFEIGIGITGIDVSGVINPGDIVYDTAKGFIIKLKTGTADDFELLDPAGNIIFNIPTGTKVPDFQGGIRVTGGTFQTGAVFKSATSGLALGAITGSLWDFILIDPSNTFGIILVPTGTTDIAIQGNIIQLVGKYVEILERGAGDPANGPVNSGRLYCKDNGAGKTQLAIRFNTGAGIILATEV